jgi:hypothetical protein
LNCGHGMSFLVAKIAWPCWFHHTLELCPDLVI